MTISHDRVREVIESSGLSQGEFASAVGLDGPKLSKALGGIRRFSSLDVARIAELGNVSVDWLLGGDEPAATMAARRSAGSASGAATAAAERFTELREVAAELGYPLTFEPIDVGLGERPARHDGQALAEAALHRVGDPTAILAADLAGLVESVFGVDVAITHLGKGFDGLAVSTTQAKLIMAAPTAIPARQRYTMAHELGHLLAGDDQGIHLDQEIWAPGVKDPSEVRANAFAAAFLMPATLLQGRVGPGFQRGNFAELSIDFTVSPSALAIRLESLNLIDKLAASAYQKLSLTEAAKLAGRSSEVSTLAAVSSTERVPKLLAEALFAAYAAGETTLRPYAEVLGVDPDALREQLESAEVG